jgi:1-deoxy-D-xylulose-5-phosphate synthase
VEYKYNPVFKRLGIPDNFIEHGEQTQLYNICGFSTEQIVDTVLAMKNNTKYSLGMLQIKV